MDSMTTILLIVTISLVIVLIIQTANINKRATKRFEDFKNLELDRIRKEMEISLKENSRLENEVWKSQYEFDIRKDAINRSRSVILGKVSEHLAPFHNDFPFNPKDARFIGTPIDIIVFDGLDEEKEIINIVFVEVKTGNSKLNRRQKLIKEAVFSKNILWRELVI